MKCSKVRKGVVLASCVVAMALVMALCTALVLVTAGASAEWRASVNSLDNSIKLDKVGEDFVFDGSFDVENYQNIFDISVENNTLTVRSKSGKVLLTVEKENGNKIVSWKYGE